MRDMEIDFGSWPRVAEAFDDVATSAPQRLLAVVDETTSSSACGAAGGFATVDAAIGTMLEVFGEIMRSSVATSLGDGLTGEAAALHNTGQTLKRMEESNTDLAHTTEGWL